MPERTDTVYIKGRFDTRKVTYDTDGFSEETRVYWLRHNPNDLGSAYYNACGAYMVSAEFSGTEHPDTQLKARIMNEIGDKLKELVGEKDFINFRIRNGWELRRDFLD